MVFILLKLNLTYFDAISLWRFVLRYCVVETRSLLRFWSLTKFQRNICQRKKNIFIEMTCYRFIFMTKIKNLLHNIYIQYNKKDHPLQNDLQIIYTEPPRCKEISDFLKWRHMLSPYLLLLLILSSSTIRSISHSQ